MAVPNIFATATTSIPLSQLDANFAYFANAITVNYSSTALTIDSSGNIGINQGSPSFKLTASYSAPASFTNASGDYIQMWQSSGTNVLGVAINTTNPTARLNSNNSYDIAIGYAGGTTATFTTSGNVGIGTTSPATRLVVSGGGSASQIRWDVSTSPYVEEVITNAAQNTYFYKSVDASYDIWKISSSERLRLDTSGNLLLGVTSPQTVGGVTYGIHLQDAAWLFTRYSGYDGWRYGQYLDALYWNNNSADRMKLTGGGQLYTTTGTISSLSDVRYKENIEDAPNYLDKLSSVRVRKFSFKEQNSDKPTYIGVIAQELETILPEMVFDDTGSNGEQRKVVRYTDFVPMLITAVQELKTELDAVKAELSALKGA